MTRNGLRTTAPLLPALAHLEAQVDFQARPLNARADLTGSYDGPEWLVFNEHEDQE